jgi:hypothetical protein
MIPGVMPFGLKGAPATFERLMETVLAGLQWDICLIYLDDVIVLGRSFEDMVTNLRKVYDREDGIITSLFNIPFTCLSTSFGKASGSLRGGCKQTKHF